MYNNSSTHYSSSGYTNPYQQYSTGYPNTYSYPGYGQYQSQQPPPAQPVPPGENPYPSENNWSSSGYGSAQKDAVAQEMQQQKAQLIKQREDYVKKVAVLRHELEQLRIQKQELLGDGRSSNRDLNNIVKENDKLQEEIQGKMKAIQNVIEMLSSIIKDGQSMADLEASLIEKETSNTPPSTKSHSGSVSRGQKANSPESTKAAEDRFNYIHYDTGLHWCRLCDGFPETAKDLLLHLQEKDHREMAKENDVDNTPWHKLPAEPVLPSYEDAPTKRIPIKGLQFFISAPSWYCKLCDTWIGDLHCASHHLKSQAHFQNYENFVAQNPQWEMDWLKDREKAMERKGVQNSSDDSDNRKSRKKRKDKRHSSEVSAKDKKKKKRSKKRRKHSTDSSSSSSSSDSSSDDDNDKTDRSKSIRVAMRNVKKIQSIMDEDLSSRWSVLEKLVEEHKRKQDEVEKFDQEKKKEEKEDPLINQWMTVTPTQDKDRVLLDSLKDRMRRKQEEEKARQAELEKKKKEKEREEFERMKRREQEEREAAEEAERERKRREQEELDRIRDKDRNQVRFKTNYRRRRSHSESDEDIPQEKYYRGERDRDSRERYRRDSDNRSSSHKDDPRSLSRSPDHKTEDNDRKKPPGPPSYKKLPFIGRMPLFKNKKGGDDKDREKKEIKKESYEPQRKTRFEPGNLPRAFIPKPDVVCFPKLSSIPPLNIPPPPIVSQRIEPQRIEPPEPPKISEQVKKEELAPLPPPPPILESAEKQVNLSDDEVLYANPGEGIDPGMMADQYYHDYSNMNVMYSHDMYYSSQNDGVPPAPPAPSVLPHMHTLPLEPPPLPPDDDLALLGICADDMAAQSF